MSPEGSNPQWRIDREDRDRSADGVTTEELKSVSYFSLPDESPSPFRQTEPEQPEIPEPDHIRSPKPTSP